MIDARNDWLRASGHAFADELQAAGVPVEYQVDAMHGFLDKPGTPQFAKGMRLMRAWLASREQRTS